MNPCKEQIAQYAEIFKNALPLAIRLLHEHGRIMVPKADKTISGTAPLGMCYKNAYKTMDLDLCYTEGYAMKKGLIPLSHAWLMSNNGYAIDPTWSDGDYYFGIPFKESFVHDVAMRTEQYGIFESLFALKMTPEKTYEYLLSGIKIKGPAL